MSSERIMTLECDLRELRYQLHNREEYIKCLKEELENVKQAEKLREDNTDPLVVVKQVLDIVWDNNKDIESYVSYLRRLIAHMTVELMECEKDITD